MLSIDQFCFFTQLKFCPFNFGQVWVTWAYQPWFVSYRLFADTSLIPIHLKFLQEFSNYDCELPFAKPRIYLNSWAVLLALCWNWKQIVNSIYWFTTSILYVFLPSTNATFGLDQYNSFSHSEVKSVLFWDDEHYYLRYCPCQIPIFSSIHFQSF